MLKTLWLGRTDYQQTLLYQEQLVSPHLADTLLLLEHEPVYTIGRTPDSSSLGSNIHSIPIIQTNRGGQATYHGPGQLVGYPIINLDPLIRDLHVYLKTLEALLIDLLALFELSAVRREGLTGVWVEDRKIASIGVGVKKWITMHGFCLNVGSDLSGFSNITPCGIVGVEMTSLSRELGYEVATKDVADLCAKIFEEQLLARLRQTA